MTDQIQAAGLLDIAPFTPAQAAAALGLTTTPDAAEPSRYQAGHIRRHVNHAVNGTRIA